MPSTKGLTPCKDLPKFAKKWKIPQQNGKCQWKNRRYLSKTECPVISQKSNFSVEDSI
jgi:hypothetical protein